MAAWREATIEEWSSVGQPATLGATKFKVVRQTVMAQVEHLHQQLAPGSVARNQRCHRTNGASVLGVRRRLTRTLTLTLTLTPTLTLTLTLALTLTLTQTLALALALTLARRRRGRRRPSCASRGVPL